MKRRLRMVAGALAGCLLLAGCGLSAGASAPLHVKPAGIQPVPELAGVEITVGSKDFSEQLVLAYLAELALSAAGADVRDLSNIAGSNSGRDALLSGQIDLMWEYTGTAWISYLGHEEPIPDELAQFKAVAEEDLKRNGVVWSAMAPLNNTYAFAMSKANAERLGVKTVSDIARLVQERPQEATFCLESEFASRNDGMPGLQQRYGFEAPAGGIKLLGIGPIYQAVANGDTCNFGEVFTTDGRILAQNLVLVEDDKSFFPRYNASLTMRKETADRYPQITRVLEPISKKLTNDVVLKLNAQVDVDGKDPAEVARDWLVAEGLVNPA
ncbi:osmoprotectant transport system substrate-binding protein [Crossiella equi]|uniref:Osmoprotectant transport system substrate-binding protein n=1 Tax=Crossiella equi TaxID=130796 RepID=A0ABS5AFX1_9PSEU|nr:glycine betaine ABC transporter substrate-binding protein [Crossiella equi]MBP2475477.1 osmoprotectant transport system substrate-binding protein [Crossiella equi]